MTLKEKFKPFVFYVTKSFNVAQEKDKEKNATECEKIADDYAIAFVEWICEKGKVPYIKGTMDTTLKIFKKEKGYE